MPKIHCTQVIAASAMALATLCGSADACAELGGVMPLTSNAHAPAPSSLMNGALRVRTSTDAGNTIINEYAASTGEIVAYTWQGPTMPDLVALLGKYAGSYRAGAAAQADSNLHASRVVRPDVVVESGGPMRSYAGRAWLPGALPPGVTPDDFR
ncbi:DUF2844 domain-containing protein [Paraburkholderia rhynchosiae]|uniref:DUF2844 domain-containing protein n=1 Tax=Paraburkholderia rhynchosiae TaxID=487049 RepID=A0A2N7WVI5_9BURK|nr:DUF2844 domain-containing protein [Paraburkholderia rhynchosiae]PMS33498.1 hypothetical protein C0Z16_02640 [Paraburkholderia rhynchosiae]CAB3681025.1 hypothetical protein LMG27174_02666 [Paraburkholderia rhynchosiae]